MSAPEQTGDLRGTRFVDADLRGAELRGCDLSGVVMRGVDVVGAEIDSPWLLEEPGSLVVNGVDVVPFVDAELDRRFPGRSLRRATDPAGLQSAWAAIERTWQSTIDRALSMPKGTIDESVAGEWTVAQTLRHLVMATDVWLRKAILADPQPYDPVGEPNAGYEAEGGDMSVFSNRAPSLDEVLAARASHVELVRDFVGSATPALLAEERTNPWAPQQPETVLSCLRTILEEEWEHHRYAVRDLDVLATR